MELGLHTQLDQRSHLDCDGFRITPPPPKKNNWKQSGCSEFIPEEKTGQNSTKCKLLKSLIKEKHDKINKHDEFQ